MFGEGADELGITSEKDDFRLTIFLNVAMQRCYLFVCTARHQCSINKAFVGIHEGFLMHDIGAVRREPGC
jgi:hypothetical protein